MQTPARHVTDKPGQAKQPFAITVEFELADGAGTEFIRLVRENAAASVRDEPGCRRFDVLWPEADGAGSVFLYEIYDDRAAFDAHLASAHYESFDRLTKAMIRRKTVKAFSVVEAAKA